jgi:hypothetical protein
MKYSPNHTPFLQFFLDLWKMAAMKKLFLVNLTPLLLTGQLWGQPIGIGSISPNHFTITEANEKRNYKIFEQFAYGLIQEAQEIAIFRC